MLLFFLLTASASAQVMDALKRMPAEDKAAPPRTTFRICGPSRAQILAHPPLWVVNDKVVKSISIQDYIRASSIQSFNVLKDSSAIKLYGEQAKNGVIKVGLKKNLELWNLEELLKNFKVKKRNRKLPIFVNENKLTDYTDFYVVNDIIESVKVVEEEDQRSGKNRFLKVLLKPE